MSIIKRQESELDDFGKDLLGDDSALKTNPQSEEGSSIDKGKKKIIKKISSKIAGQQEPVSITIKNKYKNLAANDKVSGDADDGDE